MPTALLGAPALRKAASIAGPRVLARPTTATNDSTSSPPLMSARDYVAALSQRMDARIDARPRAAWRNWMSELVKELAKNAIRHPNRRWPTLHDWRCNSHSSRYDGAMTEGTLDWRPVKDKDTMVARGIADAVDWFMR